MKKHNLINFSLAISSLVIFIIWTVLVCCFDVRPIGPENSSVGFASLNSAVHSLTGTKMSLYTVTDWLELASFGFVIGFGIIGAIQVVKRKSIMKVDRDILILGCFYIVMLAAFIFFEVVEINYRPILIDGELEASYPSSTTMLVTCVIPTAIIQLNGRLRNKTAKTVIFTLMIAFTAFIVVGRIFSGVHWISDIIGGILLSASLVSLYYAFVKLTKNTN